MARVVVVSSINVDLVVVSERLPAAGETVAGGSFASYGGGKSANQAVAAARLGADVEFVGAVGRDAMGDEAEAALREEGIDVAGLARVDAPTGVALIVVDAQGENQIAVASGANAALDAPGIATRLDELLTSAADSPAAAADTPAAAPPPPAADTSATDSPPAPGPGPGAPAAPAGVVLLGHEV